MSLDDRVFHSQDGWIAFIYGPMFSGKSEELIRLLSRAETYGKLKVQAFKPIIDDRYGQGINSHNGSFFNAEDINDADEITGSLKGSTQIIAVSEVQFLRDNLRDYSLEWKDKNKKVILEGLLFDFRHELFPLKNSGKTAVEFLKIADYHILMKAVCEDCGKPALYTRRNVESTEQVLVGGRSLYSATCLEHHRILE